MARNRKRRSAGRERRPGPPARPGVATASGNRSEDAPDPLEHATPDVELAEAQLAIGRPGYAEGELAAAQPGDEAAPDEDDGEDSEAEAADDWRPAVAVGVATMRTTTIADRRTVGPVAGVAASTAVAAPRELPEPPGRLPSGKLARAAASTVA